jgi:hypothetical protein
LNAIIPNLSKASYSCKKYPAFLNSNVSSFPALTSFNLENSDRHTRAASFFGRQWQVFVLSNFSYSATAQEDTFMFFAAVACGWIWRLPTFARRIEMRDAVS